MDTLASLIDPYFSHLGGLKRTCRRTVLNAGRPNRYFLYRLDSSRVYDDNSLRFSARNRARTGRLKREMMSRETPSVDLFTLDPAFGGDGLRFRSVALTSKVAGAKQNRFPRCGRVQWLVGLVALLGCGAIAARAQEGPLKLYVSGSGNDSWSGKLEEAKPDRSDGPLATPGGARDRVRELRAKSGGHLSQPVTIYLRGGRYELAAPFVLTPEDSGTESQPVTLCAFGSEHPILSGGRRVTLSPQTEAGKDVWVGSVGTLVPGQVVRELWVDGHRRTRARFPATGYLKVASSPESAKDWRQSLTKFHFHDDDLKAWPNATDAELIVMSHWVESRLPVKEIDEKEKIVHFRKKTTNGLDPGDVYFLEGSKDFLSEPGQWCEDSASQTVRYLPLPGEKDLKAVEAIVPALQQVMRLGRRAQGREIRRACDLSRDRICPCPMGPA